MSDHDPQDNGGPPPLAEARRPANAVTVSNPFGNNTADDISARGRVLTGLVSVEQQRAVAEVQARMLIARANPRDPIRCMDMILRDCTRSSLAQVAVYQYARGGTSISGPSIRLAEAIAQRWGNLSSGVKEISRDRLNGTSECVAYAWDLESGFYDERQFQVRHWRDTKAGGYKLTDERDIYELIANMGQRRKRAVLLTVIPGDVVEAAVAQCEETLETSADVSQEGIKRVLDAFAAIGVTQKQIELRCQCRAEAIRPAQIVQLRKIYASLRDEMSSPADWFAPDPGDVGETIEQRRQGVIRYANRSGIPLDAAKVHDLNPDQIAPLTEAIVAADQVAFTQAATALGLRTNGQGNANGQQKAQEAAGAALGRQTARRQARAQARQEAATDPREETPPPTDDETEERPTTEGNGSSAKPDYDLTHAATIVAQIDGAESAAQIDGILRSTINVALLDRWSRDRPELRSRVMRAAAECKTAMEASK